VTWWGTTGNLLEKEEIYRIIVENTPFFIFLVGVALVTFFLVRRHEVVRFLKPTNPK
jgi:hypothetical protein